MAQLQQAEAANQEQEEEILGSDDEEQEDPNDYCKGKCPPFLLISGHMCTCSSEHVGRTTDLLGVVCG